MSSIKFQIFRQPGALCCLLVLWSVTQVDAQGVASGPAIQADTLLNAGDSNAVVYPLPADPINAAGSIMQRKMCKRLIPYR